MDGNTFLHRMSASKFIDYCEAYFGWKDLSSDVIMDFGCGVDGYCGKRILKTYPNVGTIIAVNKDPKEAHNLGAGTTTKIEYVVADIEKRESLRNYEGRMTKVISTHVFHQLVEKEEAFRNVYHLLRPGGEAAVFFATKCLFYEWLTEMLKDPKWRDAYQGRYIENLYKSRIGEAWYKKMVTKIGFKAVKCLGHKRVHVFPLDQVCKEALYEMCGKSFNISPELLEEFKEESFQVLLKLSARDEEGRPCYRSIELSLLLTKPTEGSASESEEKKWFLNH